MDPQQLDRDSSCYLKIVFLKSLFNSFLCFWMKVVIPFDLKIVFLIVVNYSILHLNHTSNLIIQSYFLKVDGEMISLKYMRAINRGRALEILQFSMHVVLIFN